jgi:hypothetical protein
MSAKPVRTMDQAHADGYAAQWARDRGLSTEDPIVKSLRQFIAMRLGWSRWRAGIKADKLSTQQSLFQSPSVVEIPVPKDDAEDGETR